MNKLLVAAVAVGAITAFNLALHNLPKREIVQW